MIESAELNNALDRIPKTNSEAMTGNVINYLLYAAGILAVVMIVVAGLQMVTSAGDAGAVTKAKRTLVYAVVGLAIVILAYAIVNFVVGRVG